jgi:hypothetical protein
VVILCYFANSRICGATIELAKLTKLDVDALERHIGHQKRTKRKVSKIVLTSFNEDESFVM